MTASTVLNLQPIKARRAIVFIHLLWVIIPTITPLTAGCVSTTVPSAVQFTDERASHLRAKWEAEEKERREDEAILLAEEMARREVEAIRKAAEEKAKKEAEEIRKAAEEKARKEAEEQRIAAEEARREAEERIRKEEEKRWLSARDNLDYKFPLRGMFPNPIKLYRDLDSGCSIDWTRSYIEHSRFSADDGTSPFHFRDGNRIIDLTFATIETENGNVAEVLVGAKINFTGGELSIEDLTEKYQTTFPNAVFSQLNETETDFGVSASVHVVRIHSGAIEVIIREVISVSRKDEKGPNATDAALDRASSAKLYEAEAAAGLMMLAMAIDMKADELNAERQQKNLSAWRSLIGKPVVSVTDAKIAKVVARAKHEKLQAEKEAAERTRKAERDRLLNSF